MRRAAARAEASGGAMRATAAALRASLNAAAEASHALDQLQHYPVPPQPRLWQLRCARLRQARFVVDEALAWQWRVEHMADWLLVV